MKGNLTVNGTVLLFLLIPFYFILIGTAFYTLYFNTSGSAELRDNSTIGNQAYYVENKGNGQITLMMQDGRHLGISDAMSDGIRVKAVNNTYIWNVYSENNNDIYSLRRLPTQKWCLIPLCMC